ncbi:MAG: hypothetical protein GY754_41810 [bacterium]|nr:hypothetical protein [bacterium]
MKIKNKIRISTRSKKLLIFSVPVLLILIAIGSAACTTMSRIPFKGAQKMTIEQSENYKNGLFINPSGNGTVMKSKAWDTMKEYLFGKQERVPKEPLDVLTVDPGTLLSTDEEELKVTWLGHSSTIIEIEGSLIFTDPIFSKRPSPVSFAGPKRYHRSLALNPKDFPEIDLVIISHDHYDHLDYGTIKKIHHKVKQFITPLGVGAYLVKWGVSPEKITELDWWQETKTIKGLKIAATPSEHFSGRGLFDTYETLWASWVIKGNKHRVFYSGDSAYTPAFKKIGQKYGPFDITLMENGQYNERWEHVHMLPEQSLQAHLDLRGKVMIPVHWGAYNLSFHDWFEPVERLLKAAEKHPVTIATPRIGETVVYDKYIPTAYWWLNQGKKEKAVAGLSSSTGKMALSEK